MDQDEYLLALLKQNDSQAFTCLYKRYWQDIYVSVNNLLRDPIQSEDIVQEVFTLLWNKRNNILITKSLKSYLFTVARYMVFRHIAQLKVRGELFDQLEERLTYNSPDILLEEKETLLLIAETVAALPEKCREVYRLSRDEQLSHKEIAERLKISAKTVENHITRALRAIKISVKAIGTILLALLSQL